MPIDAVGAVPVTVQQGTIKPQPGDFLHTPAQPEKRRRPGPRDQRRARIAVVGPGVAEPGVEARNEDFPAGDANAALLPGDIPVKRPIERIRLLRRQKRRPEG